jgi:hypothetical protein
MFAYENFNKDSSASAAASRSDLQKNDGWIALMLAASNSNANDNMEIVKLLMEGKDNLDSQDKNGATVLGYPYTDSSSPTVEPSLDLHDTKSCTALFDYVRTSNLSNEMVGNHDSKKTDSYDVLESSSKNSNTYRSVDCLD